MVRKHSDTLPRQILDTKSRTDEPWPPQGAVGSLLVKVAEPIRQRAPPPRLCDLLVGSRRRFLRLDPSIAGRTRREPRRPARCETLRKLAGRSPQRWEPERGRMRRRSEAPLRKAPSPAVETRGRGKEERERPRH